MFLDQLQRAVFGLRAVVPVDVRERQLEFFGARREVVVIADDERGVRPSISRP